MRRVSDMFATLKRPKPEKTAQNDAASENTAASRAPSLKLLRSATIRPRNQAPGERVFTAGGGKCSPTKCLCSCSHLIVGPPGSLLGPPEPALAPTQVEDRIEKSSVPRPSTLPAVHVGTVQEAGEAESENSGSGYEPDNESDTSHSPNVDQAPTCASASVPKVIVTPATPARIVQRRSGGQYAHQEPAQEAAREVVQEAIQDPPQEAIQDLAQETVHGPIQETVQDPVREPVQETAQEAVQEPVQIVRGEGFGEGIFGRIIGLMLTAFLILCFYIIETLSSLLRFGNRFLHQGVTAREMFDKFVTFITEITLQRFRRFGNLFLMMARELTLPHFLQFGNWLLRQAGEGREMVNMFVGFMAELIFLQIRYMNEFIQDLFECLGEAIGGWIYAFMKGFRKGLRQEAAEEGREGGRDQRRMAIVDEDL